eukprot:3228599-Pleurochrysis_carterae.AAC.2
MPFETVSARWKLAYTYTVVLAAPGLCHSEGQDLSKPPALTELPVFKRRPQSTKRVILAFKNFPRSSAIR